MHCVVSSTLSILFRGGSLDEFAVTLDHFDSSLDLLQLVQAIGQREDESSGPELQAEVGDLLVILQSDEPDLVKVDEHFSEKVAKVTELSQSSTDTQNTVVDVEGCNSSLTELNRLEKTEKLTTGSKICLKTVPAGYGFLASALAEKMPGIKSSGNSQISGKRVSRRIEGHGEMRLQSKTKV